MKRLAPSMHRLLALVLAASCVAGVVMTVVPQHAASVALVAGSAVLVVQAAGLLAVAAVVVGRDRPVTALDRVPGVGAEGLEPAGLREARSELEGARGQNGLPVRVWERLVVGAVVRFHRHGIDVDAARSRDQARALVDAPTWQVLTTPPGRISGASAPTAQVVDTVAVVHRTLDALDRLRAEPREDQR